MSGRRVVIIMVVSILATSAMMFTLYFLTRQLDYVPPSEAPEEPAAPYVRLFASPERASP
jgi:flagellar basal body-associated protein FliL